MALEALLTPFFEIPEDINTDDLPDMHDLPCNKGPEEPGVPDIFHQLQPNLLTATFKVPMQHFCAADLNLYYDPRKTGHFKRPDWMAVLGTDVHYKSEPRKSFVLWKEPFPPLIVVELPSYGTEAEDLGINKSTREFMTKFDVYKDVLKLPYYVVFDREDTTCTCYFKWQDGKYQTLDCMDGDWVSIPVPEVGLELRSWVGTYGGCYAAWLRWYDMDGNMIPTPEEDAEFQRAEKLKERHERMRLTDENKVLARKCDDLAANNEVFTRQNEVLTRQNEVLTRECKDLTRKYDSLANEMESFRAMLKKKGMT